MRFYSIMGTASTECHNDPGTDVLFDKEMVHPTPAEIVRRNAIDEISHYGPYQTVSEYGEQTSSGPIPTIYRQHNLSDSVYQHAIYDIFPDISGHSYLACCPYSTSS